MSFLARHFPSSYNRLVDPFVGGGSSLPYTSNNFLAGDTIPELVALWRVLQIQPNVAKNIYRALWIKLQTDGDFYYRIRELFNKTRNPLFFLFLTRTCYSGLIRYNKNGDFNSPFHFGRPGIHPDKFDKIVDLWGVFLKNGKFAWQDYQETLQQTQTGDFVFLDPPYIGTKGQYLAQPFDHLALYNSLEELNSKGIKWMLTLGNSGENAVPQELYTKQTKTPKQSSSLGRLAKQTKQSYDIVYINYDSDKI
jgi:DNA adenine methylase